MLTLEYWEQTFSKLGARSAVPLKWLLLLGAMGFALSGTTGCGTASYLANTTRPMDNLFLGYRDHVWANRAYNMAYRGQSRPLMSHHRKGFIAGYCDVCRGGDGYVPALPPDEYWSYEYQSSQGQECVKAWFEGYPEGVAAARRTGVDRYRDVYVSEEVKAALAVEQNNRFLPSDVAVVPADRASSDRGQPAAIPIHTEMRSRPGRSVHQLPRIELPWMSVPHEVND